MNARSILGILLAMWQGFIDSLRGALVIFSIDKQINQRMNKSPKIDPNRRDSSIGPSPTKKKEKESKVLRRTLECCLLNGGACWASIIIFEYGIITILKFIITIIFGQSETALFFWTWFHSALSFIFQAAYVVPIFVLSKIVNMFWFQDIADCAYRYRQGRPMNSFISYSKLIADIMFSTLVQALFLFQGLLVSKMPLPPIGQVLSFVHMCLLYALYAFEYKWFNMGWELHRRLEFIEYNWPYFIGFGFPLAIVTQFPDSIIVSGCIFSILFPLFIISGNEAEPVTDKCDFPLKLFSPVVAISNFIFNKTMGPAKVR